MRLMLTATGDNRLIRILRRYADDTRCDGLEIVSDAARADLVVFAETVDQRDPHCDRVRFHPLTQSHPGKVVLFNEDEKSRARMPTLAVAAIDVPWQMGIGSLPIHEDQPPLERVLTEPTALMSLVGSRSSRVRKRIFDRYAATHEAVIDTDAFDAWHSDREERLRQRRTFESALAAGLFALCPKGAGTTSLRLYEAMQAGRCPVILADDWVEDFGIDWSFALRVPERDYGTLEERLRAMPRKEALERGAEGRRQWEETCSPSRYVGTLARAGRALLERNVTVPPRTIRELVDETLYLCRRQAMGFKRRFRDSKRMQPAGRLSPSSSWRTTSPSPSARATARVARARRTEGVR